MPFYKISSNLKNSIIYHTRMLIKDVAFTPLKMPKISTISHWKISPIIHFLKIVIMIIIRMNILKITVMTE